MRTTFTDHMHLRPQASLMLMLSAAALACGSQCLHADVQHPNILFIAVDDLRPELGCYGVETIKTPHIDSLARRGVVFDRAYCQQAVCNPSRVSLLTGLRPDTTKVWDLVTQFRDTVPDAVTLPQYFKQQGYYAVGMGKIFHNPFPDPISWSVKEPEPKGYQTYSAETRRKLEEKREEARAEGMTEEQIGNRIRGPATEIEDVPDNQRIDGALGDLAIEQLRTAHAQHKPFFLAVGFLRPHLPWTPPKKYWDMYDPEEIPLAENGFLPRNAPEVAFGDRALGGMYELRDCMDFKDAPTPFEGSLSEADQRRLKHGYYASVSFVDAQVGRVLDELERLGLRESTFVVLWGDHGWKLGEHNGWCKQTNYEVDTRVPLIIAAPGARANGVHSASLVEFVDIYPTLCQLAGLPVPGQLEGMSLAPILENPKNVVKQAAYSQFPRLHEGVRYMGYAVRTEGYRYVEWINQETGEASAVELYDEVKDPGENENIASRPENSVIAAQMRTELWNGFEKPRPMQPTGAANPTPSPEQRHAEPTPDPEGQPDLVASATQRPHIESPGYRLRDIEGWDVYVSRKLLRDDKVATKRALQLMRVQLRTIADRVPTQALDFFRTVPLWVSPQYEGIGPKAEYHPGAGWLREHGRDPQMAKAVEFTNVDIFEKECERMPLFVLHELAHAYHDQVLGYNDPVLKSAWERAKASGKYEAVENHAGKTMRAYGMNNPQEYFAESTEAFFGRNDFYPFDAEQLEAHDPNMFALLERIWRRP